VLVNLLSLTFVLRFLTFYKYQSLEKSLKAVLVSYKLHLYG